MQDKRSNQDKKVAQRYKIGDPIKNQYEVHNVLTGGFGVVYICYDHKAHIPLAIIGIEKSLTMTSMESSDELYTW
jgi:hypothetical protein